MGDRKWKDGNPVTQRPDGVPYLVIVGEPVAVGFETADLCKNRSPERNSRAETGFRESERHSEHHIG
jgi:hypothetical protein